MIKALIFDFDGLMVDTETPRFEAWRKTYQHFGADVSKDEWCALTADTPHFDPCDELEHRLGSAVGVTAARAAGLACVAVPNGMTRHLDLNDAVLALQSLSDKSLSEVLAALGLREP